MTTKDEKEITSEFGKGLTYCIGLFLAHAERSDPPITLNGAASLFFNASSDHLYELESLHIKDINLRKRIEEWRDKCLRWGHGFEKPKATKEDKEWAIQEAKDLLRLIDEKLLKIKTIKGSWE